MSKHPSRSLGQGLWAYFFEQFRIVISDNAHPVLSPLWNEGLEKSVQDFPKQGHVQQDVDPAGFWIVGCKCLASVSHSIWLPHTQSLEVKNHANVLGTLAREGELR